MLDETLAGAMKPQCPFSPFKCPGMLFPLRHHCPIESVSSFSPANPSADARVRLSYSVFLRRLLLTVVVCLNTSVGFASPNEAASALARLRSLAGEWQGTFQWTGARTATGTMNATYYITGNNSAIVENLTVDGVPTMTSVYHLDGRDLRMTHYCGAGNQPRLKAQHIDMGKGVVDFDFVDATNLSSPDAPHVTGVGLRLLDDNHMTLNFRFQSGTKESHEEIKLSRVNQSSAPQPSPASSTAGH